VSVSVLDDVDFSADELDCAGAGCKERKIPADTYVFAGKELGPALADDYTAGLNYLAGV